jgi:hypothetical protein
MCIRHKTEERFSDPCLYHSFYASYTKLDKGSVNLIFITVFKPHTHKLYILRHCTNIVYLSRQYQNRSGPSWPCSYGSWIYNYLCNRCPSPLMLWVRIPFRERCTPLCDQVCQWLAAGRWFSLITPVSSTNKTDHHDITEILLKVALNTTKPKYLNRSCICDSKCFW